MKKILLAIFFVALLFSCAKKAKNDPDRPLKIGVIQFVAHPALDRSLQGFKDSLKKDHKNITFIVKNANGEISTANIIASSFEREHVDLIYAIATPSAQAAMHATTNIPIIFSAVTNPKDAGIVAPNITGVSDYVDIQEQLSMVNKIDKKIKTIGVLYNSSEANSLATVALLKKACANLNLNLELKSVTQISEVPQAVKYLVTKVDAIYTPTDNLIASVLPIISDEAIAQKKIVIGSEKAHVEAGALITKGIDYFKLGQRAGSMANDILFKNVKVSSIPVATMPLSDISVNNDTLKKLGITLPSDLK